MLKHILHSVKVGYDSIIVEEVLCGHLVAHMGEVLGT